MSAAETGQMSAVETRQMLKSQIMGRAQNHKNGSKWVQNGRQVSRIHPNESCGRSRAFATGPGAQDLPKQVRNSTSGRSRPWRPDSNWTPPSAAGGSLFLAGPKHTPAGRLFLFPLSDRCLVSLAQDALNPWRRLVFDRTVSPTRLSCFIQQQKRKFCATCLACK